MRVFLDSTRSQHLCGAERHAAAVSRDGTSIVGMVVSIVFDNWFMWYATPRLGAESLFLILWNQLRETNESTLEAKNFQVSDSRSL